MDASITDEYSTSFYYLPTVKTYLDLKSLDSLSRIKLHNNNEIKNIFELSQVMSIRVFFNTISTTDRTGSYLWSIA